MEAMKETEFGTKVA